MSRFKVLVLTDHSNHTKENSIYALVNAMKEYKSCEFVDVATRADRTNKAFFSGDNFSKINAVRISDSLYFSAEGRAFINTRLVDTSDYDLIFLRLPRPVGDEFLLRLENHFSKTVIINKPSGIIECASKSFLLNFLDLCPPIKLCHSINDVLDFSKKFDLVLKPLREYGGKGLVKIVGDKLFIGNEELKTMEYLRSLKDEIESEGYLAMKYLPNVKMGDKRSIVVDGEILASSLRLPAKGSWLCNVAQGGKAIAASPDPEEFEIVEKINPVLKSKGVLIYGIDTLVNDEEKRVLSEINALSIGGFPQSAKSNREANY